MEESSATGMIKNKMEKLRQQYNNFLNLPFPDSPEEGPLYDIFAELVLIDGHIAGIVESFLKGIKNKKSLIYVDEEFNNTLNAIKSQDIETKKEWLLIKNRKDELDKLTRMVLELYDEV